MNRYEGVPGVVYPKKREAVLAEVPEGYMCTRVAAELLGCSKPYVRQLCWMYDVEGVLVRQACGNVRYWPQDGVMKVKSEREAQKGGKA